jgi:hypothetical protein
MVCPSFGVGGTVTGSEPLEAEAIQTLYSHVGSHDRAVGVLRVVAEPEAALVSRRLLT